ncbi:MAG: ribonuclease P protein component [Candidatus Shikimatogenerans sp. JK-2022]|nr:ribonuclease P protein component [Candidatus Shikimatogenerans bostrichidophilus]
MFLNKKEIKLVFKKGYYYYLKIYKIIFYKKKNINKNKICIIIPKKKIKKSVIRNKIKRRILNSLIINNFFKKTNKFNFIIIIYINNKILKFSILNKYIKDIIILINNERIFNNRIG